MGIIGKKIFFTEVHQKMRQSHSLQTSKNDKFKAAFPGFTRCMLLTPSSLLRVQRIIQTHIAHGEEKGERKN
ncbi:MAG: hypothetical protein EBV97_07300 [Rhodobacteraceae bacterium]|nr:hypothetical protein [Paracoccaceae bacterium]